MFVSRIVTSIALKYQTRFLLNPSRCSLSSTVSSEKKINEENNPSDSISEKSSKENNAWLWAYLRSQTTFADLTEEQKRRVIEIGNRNYLLCSFIHSIVSCRTSDLT